MLPKPKSSISFERSRFLHRSWCTIHHLRSLLIWKKLPFLACFFSKLLPQLSKCSYRLMLTETVEPRGPFQCFHLNSSGRKFRLFEISDNSCDFANGTSRADRRPFFIASTRFFSQCNSQGKPVHLTRSLEKFWLITRLKKNFSLCLVFIALPAIKVFNLALNQQIHQLRYSWKLLYAKQLAGGITNRPMTKALPFSD